MILRNKSVFKRPTGFGTSNSQRPKSLWGRVASTGDASESQGDGRDREKEHIPRRPASAAPSNSAAARNRCVVMRVSVPTPETATADTLAVRANASEQPRRSPRPQSAASRTRRRRPGPMSGFGSSSSRIIPYRGHNHLDENTKSYMTMRIDPVQQAKEMMAAANLKMVSDGRRSVDARRDQALPKQRPRSALRQNRSLTASANGISLRKVRRPRPASAGPGRRRRRGGQKYSRVQDGSSIGGGDGGGGNPRRIPRRPKSAAAGWMRRRRRVPRPEWRSIL